MRIVQREYEWLIVVRFGHITYWMDEFRGTKKEVWSLAHTLPLHINRLQRDLRFSTAADFPDDFTISVRVLRTDEAEYRNLINDLKFDDRCVQLDTAEDVGFQGNGIFE